MVHIDQHAFLNGLREHGYSGIDKWTMVRYLTTGMKTPTLDHVSTQILSNASLRKNLSACITQKEAEFSKNPKSSSRSEQNTEVANRYYNKAPEKARL